VPAAVFNTVETAESRLLGSIPRRSRQNSKSSLKIELI